MKLGKNNRHVMVIAEESSKSELKSHSEADGITIDLRAIHWFVNSYFTWRYFLYFIVNGFE